MISSYYPIKEDGKVLGFIGVDYNVEDEYKAFERFRIIMGIISLGILGICTLLGISLSRNISKPIVNIAYLADKMANYNLHIEKMDTKDKGEIGFLSNSFNEMNNNIHSLIKGIKEIEEHSKLIGVSSQDVSASSEEVSKTIEKMASGLTYQAGEINSSLKITNDLSCKIEDILEKINYENKDAMVLKEKNSLGMESMIELDKSFGEDNKGRMDMRARIMELAEKSKSIEPIKE